MKYKTYSPYGHQEYGMELYSLKGNIALLWEMGAGKTFGQICILRVIYYKANRLKRTLIISPLVTLNNWKDEFEMHSYIAPSDVLVLSKGGSAGKVKKMLKYAFNRDRVAQDKILITNYESMNSEAFFNLIMEWRPEVIVLDEAHYIKNPKAKRSKAIIRLGKDADDKFILTGTPILNDVRDIFNLYLFLDDGETFGKNYYVFQSRYMEDANAGWSGKSNHFSKWVTREETYAELSDKVYERGHRVLTTDVIDLPPLIRMIRHVELGPEQKKAYKEMERDFITFVEDKEKAGEPAAVVATIAAVKALRLQQIASGYMSDEDGIEHEFDKNPRAELAKELLQEIVVQGKHSCILWCSFKQNYRQLSRICTDLGIEHCFITGEQSLEEKTLSMTQFNDGTKPVVIANRRAGGIGINLIKGKYSITYSRNFSLGEELQSSARNYRGGSQMHDKVIKIDISAKDTVDEIVADALFNKKDISNKIIDVVRRKV